MSWRKMTMKYAGNCIVCNNKVEAGEVGFWAQGQGVKHEKCAEVKELVCIVCGRPAGCEACEFAEDCDLDKVSQLCMCKQCSDSADPLGSYRDSVKKKFRVLNV